MRWDFTCKMVEILDKMGLVKKNIFVANSTLQPFHTCLVIYKTTEIFLFTEIVTHFLIFS